MNDVEVASFANQLPEILAFLNDRGEVEGSRFDTLRMLQ